MSESLPPRPHLDWLKNRASERLVALREVDPATPLADALLAVARDYGYPSWRKLKAAVEARRATAAPGSARDEKAVLAEFRGLVNRGDAAGLAALLEAEPAARGAVNAPVFAFDGRPIHAARAHPAVVDLLLAHGADINLKSAWWAGGFGVLETADAATAEFLISRGAVVDVWAAAHLDRLDRVRELLDADPSLVHAKGGDGCRALHFAASAEMVDLLLDRGAEIDARDVDHESTAAQWLTNGSAPHPAVRRLIERGAAVDVFMAAALDDVPRLSALLDADPSLADAQVGGPGVPLCPQAPGEHIYVYRFGRGQTPLEVAWKIGNERAVHRLLEAGSPRQRLLAACSVGSRPVVEAALHDDPTAIDSLTPADHSRLARAAWDGNLNAVRLMLDVGFDPAAPGPDTGTALHCAAWQGSADLVELILSHPHFRPELVDATEPTHGSTPLGWCCHGSTVRHNSRGDYPAVARLLLAAGATVGPNLKDAAPAVRAVLVHQVIQSSLSEERPV
jgi:ankyrin repeat protein